MNHPASAPFLRLTRCFLAWRRQHPMRALLFDFPLSLRSPVWLVALWLGGALLSETAAAERELTWWAGELSAAAGFDWSAGDYDEPRSSICPSPCRIDSTTWR